MGCCASLDPDNARGKFLKERENARSTELLANDDFTGSVDAVDLENVLRNNQTDRCNCLHVGFLRIVAHQFGNHCVALTRRWD